MIEIDDVPLNWLVTSISISIVATIILLFGLYICCKCYKKKFKNQNLKTLGSLSENDDPSTFVLDDIMESDEDFGDLGEDEKAALKRYADTEDPFEDEPLDHLHGKREHED
jgi:hypothetical protein